MHYIELPAAAINRRFRAWKNCRKFTTRHCYTVMCCNVWSLNMQYCKVLCCTLVQYNNPLHWCTVLLCKTVLYCITVLYCVVLHCTTSLQSTTSLQCTTLLYCTAMHYFTVLYCTTLQSTNTLQCTTAVCCTAMHYFRVDLKTEGKYIYLIFYFLLFYEN